MQILVILLLILSNSCLGFFHKHFFTRTNKLYFKDEKQEYSKHISYPSNFTSIIEKFNGFYGLIGPNIDFYKAKSLIELFTGNGLIQGVFFNNGKITHINHCINTEKKIFEEKYGKMTNHIFTSVLLITLQKLNLFPISLGTANTALINFNNKTLALYETDYPYSVDINFKNSSVSTISKEKIFNLTSFSGHTKFINNTVETIEYDLLHNRIDYIKLSSELSVIEKKSIYTKYIPVVHDFISTENYFIFVDSPLSINTDKIFCNSFPVSLSDRPTYIHTLNKKTNIITTYSFNESFYIFHFSDIIEKENNIYIHAPVVDNLDFSNIVFNPHVREIVLHTKNKTTSINTFPHFENIDLDFPIKLNDGRVLFTIIKDTGFSGICLTKDMKIIKNIYFNNRILCGEPSIACIDNIEYLLGFIKNDSNDGFIYFLNLYDYTSFEIPLGTKPENGFHSIYIPK